MVVFNGVILYYMFKSKAREYFNQTSTKKPKIKKSKIKESKIKESKIKESKIKESKIKESKDSPILEKK